MAWVMTCPEGYPGLQDCWQGDLWLKCGGVGGLRVVKCQEGGGKLHLPQLLFAL